jgi:hypothetical protein
VDVEVGAEPAEVDRRRVRERSDGVIGSDELPPSHRRELPDRNAVARDDERLPPVQSPHHLSAAVPKLLLRDRPSHTSQV